MSDTRYKEALNELDSPTRTAIKYLEAQIRSLKTLSITTPSIAAPNNPEITKIARDMKEIKKLTEQRNSRTQNFINKLKEEYQLKIMKAKYYQRAIIITRDYVESFHEETKTYAKLFKNIYKNLDYIGKKINYKIDFDHDSYEKLLLIYQLQDKLYEKNAELRTLSDNLTDIPSNNGQEE